MLKELLSDLWRVAAIFLLALGVMQLSPALAGLLQEPNVATFGMFAGFLFMGLAAVHVARRFLMPYLSMGTLARKAGESSTGAGLVFLGACIVIGAIILGVRPVQAGEVPPRAVALMPVLLEEQQLLAPQLAPASILMAQVDKETCAHAKHRLCWNPMAELKTSREYGFGLGQLTITSRFNGFEEVRQHPALKQWTWDDRYNPRYQLRALVVKDLQAWRQAKDTATAMDRMAMMLAAYNGGIGGLNADRRTCRATPGCNPSRWFGHVERTSYKARVAVKGYGKSFFEINREYVSQILGPRRIPYARALGEA